MIMDDDSAAELIALAEMLLLGWLDRDEQHRYFKHGSRKERAARYAIAHLLRDHDEARILKHWNFRNRLADLFDPSSVHALDVKFCFRQEGSPGHPKTSAHCQGNAGCGPVLVKKTR